MKPRTPWARDANPVGMSGRDPALVEQARRHVREIREFYVNALMFAVVIPVLWVVNLMGTPKVLWAQWPTLGWGFGVLIHGMFTFGGRSLFGPEWEERKVQEILARERLRVVSREKQLVQAQLRMLQAQIEPHFLFNTLANVQMLVRKSPLDAQAMLENLIAYLRQTLTASRAETGTVKQELDLVGNYLELLRMRMGERLRFLVDAADDVLTLSLPPMLLQPLVENAIKHGLEPKVEGGTVEVRAVREPHRDGDRIVFTVRDDGLGFDPDRKRDEAEVGGRCRARESPRAARGPVRRRGHIRGPGREPRLRDSPRCSGTSACLSAWRGGIADCEGDLGRGRTTRARRMNTTRPTAIIADDEPLLREQLRESLTECWPALDIVAEAANGHEAAALIDRHAPSVAFLDIKMPGLTGIEVAQGIDADTRVVFVTAYDQFAVTAFEQRAVDYLLKPVARERLMETVRRLSAAPGSEVAAAPALSEALRIIAQRIGARPAGASPHLRWIRASRGEVTLQIPVEDVLYFQSEDKYTVVYTREGEHLIRMRLSELAQALDPDQFWQVHRSTIVNMRLVRASRRDGEGRMTLTLEGVAKPIAVSRAYQGLFKQM